MSECEYCSKQAWADLWLGKREEVAGNGMIVLKNKYTARVIQANFCPMCGRKLVEE